MPSAVDVDGGAGNPARLLRREERDERRQVLGLPHAAHGVRGLASLEKRVVRVLVQSRLPMELSHDDAWTHGVHPNSLGRKLQGGTARELVERRFARTVSENPGERARAIDARYVHDVPLARAEVGKRELPQG